MADYLLRIASLSVGGSAAIALLLLIERLAGLRYAAKWLCLAWLLLCLRLAMPISLSWNTELPAAPIQVEVPADQVIYQAPVRPSTQPVRPAVQEHPNDAQPQPVTPDAAKPARTVTLSEALFALWLLGAIGVPGRALIGHIRFTWYLRRWSSPISERGTCDTLNELKDTLELCRVPPLLT